MKDTASAPQRVIDGLDFEPYPMELGPVCVVVERDQDDPRPRNLVYRLTGAHAHDPGWLERFENMGHAYGTEDEVYDPGLHGCSHAVNSDCPHYS